jgi:hypothetical protein
MDPATAKYYSVDQDRRRGGEGGLHSRFKMGLRGAIVKLGPENVIAMN